VWLGEGSGYERLLFAWLEFISYKDHREQAIGKLVHFAKDETPSCACCSLGSFERPGEALRLLETGFAELGRRPWFGRLWVTPM
jgi:hypothetical protein